MSDAKLPRPWSYGTRPPAEGDARKIVTLLADDMVWVGIRAYHHLSGEWYNGNEPERARVLAWMDLPQPAEKRWVGGVLL